MEIVIIAISCLLIGALAGALIVTHPIAAKNALSVSGDIEFIKAQIAALEAKIKPTPPPIPPVPPKVV